MLSTLHLGLDPQVGYMLIILLMFIVLSSAITLRRDKSVSFSRIVITSLIITIILSYNNLYIKAIEKGMSLYGGLLNITTLGQSFTIFILLNKP